MSIDFKCELKRKTRTENWTGRITKITTHGKCYELKIESRSGFLIIVGKTEIGNFACIPDFNAGCYLSNLKDKFWNTERLSQVLGKVDGITAAAALFVASDYINFD